jgi:hypothetical protein
MTAAEQYIKDFTRHCSNALTPSGYHEWLTPDNALRACEITKQETVEKICAFLEKYAANFVALPDEGQQPIGDTNAIYGTKSLLHYLRQEMEE